MSGRTADPTIKWLVGGLVASLGIGAALMMYVMDEIRFLGPSGALAVMGIGVVACIAYTAVMFGPVGRAIGKRILGGNDVAGVDEDLHDLRLQVDEMRNALAESQERLDFTERLLAGTKDRVSEELH